MHPTWCAHVPPFMAWEETAFAGDRAAVGGGFGPTPGLCGESPSRSPRGLRRRSNGFEDRREHFLSTRKAARRDWISRSRPMRAAACSVRCAAAACHETAPI